jgi:hypothetical protein
VTIFTELEYVEERGENVATRADGVLDMISDLIGQSNATYLHTLLASARQDSDQAWDSFNKGFELDDDISKLTVFHVMSRISGSSRHKNTQ